MNPTGRVRINARPNSKHLSGGRFAKSAPCSRYVASIAASCGTDRRTPARPSGRDFSSLVAVSRETYY